MNNNDQIKYLLSAKAIRERTNKLYDLTILGKTNFEIHQSKLEEVSDYVLDVIKENYPKLDIPFHSRWGHFRVGNIDRSKLIDEKLKDVEKIELARTKLDLVITSVLLDAGAGPTWKYDENGEIFNRSEGLGVASFHMFKEGYFSNNNTLTADAKKLQCITSEDIEKAFQVTENNPLIGTEGRANLLCAMGKCIESKPEIFKGGRPGNIIDHMIEKFGMTFEAEDLMKAVLYHFGDIWPSRINIEGTNLGDVWSHSLLGTSTDLNSLVPFHKLSQWLTYSLVEPIEEAGVKVVNASKMTGLAEYRNGGLILDSGLITLKNKENFNLSHKPNSEIIIEWRALTIVLLDKIADIIRKKLGFTTDEFPLAKVLEGGTWWAGRKIAKSLREDSSPPLKLDSDGTVF